MSKSNFSESEIALMREHPDQEPPTDDPEKTECAFRIESDDFKPVVISGTESDADDVIAAPKT